MSYIRECTRFYLVISQMWNDVHNLCVYLEYVRYSSPETIRKYKLYLNLFFSYLFKKWIHERWQIKLSHIEEYKKYLLRYKNESTVYKAICCIRGYFSYLSIIDKKYLHYELIDNIKRPYPYSSYTICQAFYS